MSNVNNYAQISRQLQQLLMTSKLDGQQRLELFNSLTKLRRIKSPYGVQEKGKEVPPTAFIQLAIWQCGKLDIDELDQRFRSCIQQALCDIYTEFGLLSMRIFDTAKPSEQRGATSPHPSTTSNTLQPQSSADLLWSRSEPFNLEEVFGKTSSFDAGGQQLLSGKYFLYYFSYHLFAADSTFADRAASDMDLYSTATACHASHEDALPATKQSVRPGASQALRTATSDKNLDTATSSSIDELIPSSTAMRPTRIASVSPWFF